MTTTAANLPALMPSAALALDKHPGAVYLASLAAGSGSRIHAFHPSPSRRHARMHHRILPVA